MKNIINFKHAICFTLIVAAIVSLQSCIVYRPYPENAQLLSVPDIIQMSKDSVSSKDIINEIKQSHTVYSLKADQLGKLRDEGVQDSVLNYMEETKINAIQQNQRYANSYYGYGWPGGFDTMADSVLACLTMAGDGEVLSYSVNTGVLVVDSMEEADCTVVGEGNSVWRIYSLRI